MRWGYFECCESIGRGALGMFHVLGRFASTAFGGRKVLRANSVHPNLQNYYLATIVAPYQQPALQKIGLDNFLNQLRLERAVF